MLQHKHQGVAKEENCLPAFLLEYCLFLSSMNLSALSSALFLMSISVMSALTFRNAARKTSNVLRMSTASNATKIKYVLEYVYVADILEKRTQYRPDHIALAEKYCKEGTIVSGGPFTPPTGALFVFSADGKETVEQFVKSDPYYSAGLITNYSIKEWNVVIGKV